MGGLDRGRDTDFPQCTRDMVISDFSSSAKKKPRNESSIWQRTKEWGRFGWRIAIIGASVLFIPNGVHYMTSNEEKYSLRKHPASLLGFGIFCGGLVYPFSVYGPYIFVHSPWSSLMCMLTMSGIVYHDLFFK